MNSSLYYAYYEKLIDVVNKLRPYYSIDKIKPYSVYVWDKNGEQNLFDINKSNICFYVKDYIIPEEVQPIISEIQFVLKQISLTATS